MIEFLILDMGFDWFDGCCCRMGRGKASRVKTIKRVYIQSAEDGEQAHQNRVRGISCWCEWGRLSL